jgi:lipoprotein-anchoring transpeptidase ErfK/SrfK
MAVLAVLAAAVGSGAAVGSAQAAGGTPCSALARACLSLSRQQAWLMSGGAVTYGPVPAKSGRPGYATPPGVFHVTFKDANFWSTDYNAPMPYSVFFNGGMAFHVGSLSVPSHGCVHLSRAAAIAFYNTLQRGDRVEVVS